ncbi:MAG: hypothetical protein F6K26_18780 [Moorea sp. SIO2I5]|nr:hypothetical protein [Moorena sp. SIO2I5]
MAECLHASLPKRSAKDALDALGVGCCYWRQPLLKITVLPTAEFKHRWVH